MPQRFGADARDQRWWPKLSEAKVHPGVELAFRQAFNGLYDCQDAFTALAAQAQLHPTISNGAITHVDVIKRGRYQNIPTITAIGGGGSGATFTATLDGSGGIAAVTIHAGGSGYTSAPYITIAEKTA